MYWALLKDGRKVVVNTARKTTRLVSGEPERIGNQHRELLLDGGWQVMHSSDLRPLDPANPFALLR